MVKYTIKFGACTVVNVEANSKMEAIEKARKEIHPIGFAKEEETTTISEFLKK